MTSPNQLFAQQLINLVNNNRVVLSSLKPSEWAEKHIIMPEPYAGPLRYKMTPYTREIIDCGAEDHPARRIAVMKGAQIGLSATVIMALLQWIIRENPANTFFTVGSPELVDLSSEKFDLSVDRSGTRPYLKSQIKRISHNKTGDTNIKKDFAGGYIKICTGNNHKNWRDVTLKYLILDDVETLKGATKQAGDMLDLIEQRVSAYYGREKIYYISTPEEDSTSIIKPLYLLGDQRKYLIPCPVCHEFIELVWQSPDVQGGIVWEVDQRGKLIDNSVGYCCQKCAGYFKDNNKNKLLNEGYWHPTAEPFKKGNYSYHISSLYSFDGSFDWHHYVTKYLEANPWQQSRNEIKHRTFVNLCLGLTYTDQGEAPDAKGIKKNKGRYQVGVIPESLSMKDGNGRIILLTCAADMNGKMNDGRLDYQVKAHSESGATYSIIHGSIGTFKPKDGNKDKDRELWSYDFNAQKSIWVEFDKFLDTLFPVDTDKPNIKIPIAITGLDCGYLAKDRETGKGLAYAFLETSRNYVRGVKGDKDDMYENLFRDKKPFKVSLERKDLYILTVGNYKDLLAQNMQLQWSGEGEQPANFMNFPESSGGLYEDANFFDHFESEHRVIEKTKAGASMYMWKKKSSHLQNHMFDTEIYGMALRDIWVQEWADEMKYKNVQWQDYVAYILKLMNK